jgi:hypothetical protein
MRILARLASLALLLVLAVSESAWAAPIKVEFSGEIDLIGDDPQFEWPSGKWQEIPNVSPNQFITMPEVNAPGEVPEPGIGLGVMGGVAWVAGVMGREGRARRNRNRGSGHRDLTPDLHGGCNEPVPR